MKPFVGKNAFLIEYLNFYIKGNRIIIYIRRRHILVEGFPPYPITRKRLNRLRFINYLKTITYGDSTKPF